MINKLKEERLAAVYKGENEYFFNKLNFLLSTEYKKKDELRK